MNFDEDVFRKIKDKNKKIAFDKAATESKLDGFVADKDETENNLFSAKEAQAIILSEAKDTQSEIEEHLSNVVTMALAAVEVDDSRIPKPPQFVVRMVERRDSTECDFLFKEGEREQPPLKSSGHGYCNIADYALWVSYHLLENEYSEKEKRKTLISDEPFRDADPALQHKISEMLEMISKELGFQQIIVSHAEGVNTNAERVFHVTKIGKVSKVTAEVS